MTFVSISILLLTINYIYRGTGVALLAAMADGTLLGTVLVLLVEEVLLGIVALVLVIAVPLAAGPVAVPFVVAAIVPAVAVAVLFAVVMAAAAAVPSWAAAAVSSWAAAGSLSPRMQLGSLALERLVQITLVTSPRFVLLGRICIFPATLTSLTKECLLRRLIRSPAHPHMLTRALPSLLVSRPRRGTTLPLSALAQGDPVEQGEATTHSPKPGPRA